MAGGGDGWKLTSLNSPKGPLIRLKEGEEYMVGFSGLGCGLETNFVELETVPELPASP